MLLAASAELTGTQRSQAPRTDDIFPPVMHTLIASVNAVVVLRVQARSFNSPITVPVTAVHRADPQSTLANRTLHASATLRLSYPV